MDRVGRRVQAAGLATPVQVMQCGGGVVPAAQAARKAFLTLDSGPVAGVLASQYLGQLLGQKHVIATDMGGTSFDVGLVYDGAPVASYQSVVNQYEYFVPRIDIRSIGSGGGSVIWLDEASGSLRVGPVSAGADPGPVCYGRGGTEPTVTDAALALGYLDPDEFPGRAPPARPRGGAGQPRAAGQPARPGRGRDGQRRLPRGRAPDGRPHPQGDGAEGLRPAGLRGLRLWRGGPVHAGIYARELGAHGVIVPLGGVCSLWSALGAASADLLHIHESVDIQANPFDRVACHAAFAALERLGIAQLREDDVERGAARIARSVDMRYKGQINEVEVAVPDGPLDAAALEGLAADFHRRYETLYGSGAGFREARVEIVTYRVRTSAVSPKPLLPAAPRAGRDPAPRSPGRAAPGVLGRALATSRPRRSTGASSSTPATASRAPPSSRFRTRRSWSTRDRPRAWTPTATC